MGEQAYRLIGAKSESCLRIVQERFFLLKRVMEHVSRDTPVTSLTRGDALGVATELLLADPVTDAVWEACVLSTTGDSEP